MLGLKLNYVSKRGYWSMFDPCNCHRTCLNSLAPRRCGCYLKSVIFKLVSMINILSISYEIVLRWMPQDLTDDKSTLVQVMAWCHQATTHYLNQCWTRSMSSYGITRPQRVNCLITQCMHCLNNGWTTYYNSLQSKFCWKYLWFFYHWTYHVVTQPLSLYRSTKY